jgi:Protein of unknown function (DUF998)
MLFEGNSKSERATIQKNAVMVLLAVTLAAFILGHVLTWGTIWNYEAMAIFSPLKNYVSDYAYRSPVWWLFTGCMFSFAAILAWFSWRVYSNAKPHAGRFVVVLCLSYGSLSMLEVALFPVKPPEVSLDEIQARMDANAWQKFKEATMGLFWEQKSRTAGEVFAVISGDKAHLLAISRSMLAMLLGMSASVLLLECRNGRKAILLCCGVAGGALVIHLATDRGWLPGLWQRVCFAAVFVWMLLMTKHLSGPEIHEAPIEPPSA